jgi:glycosyltransferase involved in cell wall biosynthesis
MQEESVSFVRTAVLSVDLASGVLDLPVPSDYSQAQVLIRYLGTPICNSRLQATSGRIRGLDLWLVAWRENSSQLRDLVLRDILGVQENTDVSDRLPSATIVVCTRNRTFDLRRCLDSIVPQLSKDVKALVIDNNPADDSTENLVQAYPVRYYRENRPGLNWARARAARLATTEVLLYTDDDVVLDRDWSAQLRRPFADQHTAAVAGAVVPLEFEHPSQELYEEYGGFYRGYLTRSFNLMNTIAVGAGRAGAGASMGVRRSLALSMKLFDWELDCGTPSYSGGDFYAFYQLIREGYNIVYWPQALAWHRHRQAHSDLRNILYGYGVGVYTVLLRCLLEHGDFDAVLLAVNWFRQYHLRELCRALLRRPKARPLDLIWAEIRGVFHAPRAYQVVRSRERQMGPLPVAAGANA